MKKIIQLFTVISLCFLLYGCTEKSDKIQVAATTLPVYEFTEFLCQGTDISVVRLVTEDVSCLHDYTLQTRQMQLIEESDLIVLSGAGLESFLDDALTDATKVLDSSNGIHLHCAAESHSGDHTNTHHHDTDPHIWLSPDNAAIMADNISCALRDMYPQYDAIFTDNSRALSKKFNELSSYANSQLKDLSHREIITFHDGFSYMAAAFDLKIIHSIEEEAGSEPSAQEIISLISLITDHNLPAIFVEKNNPGTSAMIISEEIGIDVYELDMGLSVNSYFDAMYHNINTLKEALK